MFAIATETRQYQTLVVSDPATQTRLEVVPERGGIITRWQVNGQEILYLDEGRFADPQLSVRGGIPILFPICGNVPDNTYTLNGQAYQLKQHGFARNLPWQVLEHHSEADRARVTLGLKSNEQTFAQYPFQFELIFTYILEPSSLTLHQRYINHSDTSMPFSSGFHPYFLVQDKSQLRFQIPATEYYDQVTQSVHAYAGSFDFERDEIDAAFTEISSPGASAIDEGRSHKVTLTFDTQFSTLVFWTIKGKDYYCLEPWTAPRNAINTGNRLLYVEPGASLETNVRLAVTNA